MGGEGTVCGSRSASRVPLGKHRTPAAAGNHPKRVRFTNGASPIVHVPPPVITREKMRQAGRRFRKRTPLEILPIPTLALWQGCRTERTVCRAPAATCTRQAPWPGGEPKLAGCLIVWRMASISSLRPLSLPSGARKEVADLARPHIDCCETAQPICRSRSSQASISLAAGPTAYTASLSLDGVTPNFKAHCSTTSGAKTSIFCPSSGLCSLPIPVEVGAKTVPSTSYITARFPAARLRVRHLSAPRRIRYNVGMKTIADSLRSKTDAELIEMAHELAIQLDCIGAEQDRRVAEHCRAMHRLEHARDDAHPPPRSS